MPVTDLSGDDDDWLQQFMAGHQAGQAFGASQPYGPGGMPGPYSGGPQGLMPGGGLYGRTQTTPGAPSMGYPALGQPGAPRPSQMATTAGFNLNSNPLTGALNWLRGGGGTPPLPANALPLAWGNPTGDDYRKWLAMQTGSPAAPSTADPAPARSGGIGSDANFPVMGAGGFPTTYANPGAQPPVPTGPVSGANPANRGVGTTRSPGAGAPAGNPSQTPQPASSNRFVQVDRPNMDVAGGGMGRGGPPQMTALNLAGLFGGRGQQAANPANMPTPNAQPVSGPLSSNAPWGMGPLQKGMAWPGAMGPLTQDQLAARGLRQRYG